MMDRMFSAYCLATSMLMSLAGSCVNEIAQCLPCWKESVTDLSSYRVLHGRYLLKTFLCHSCVGSQI
jgi:hypothetical protein